MNKFLVLSACIYVTSCQMEEYFPITECKEYTLTERGNNVDVKIYSQQDSVVLTYLQVDGIWRKNLIIKKKYYNCISFERSGTPMVFEVNGCRKAI